MKGLWGGSGKTPLIPCSGKFKGGGGTLLVQIFPKKPPFSVYKAKISLCAFAINEDGADKLSLPSLFLFEIFGSATDSLCL